MTKSNTIYILSSGTQIKDITIPTTSFNTDAVDLKTHNGGYIFNVYRSLSDGTVDFHVQCSNDGQKWVRYSPISYGSGAVLTKTQDAYPIQTAGANIDLNLPAYFQDSICVPAFLRLSFQISGSPTGTLTCSITKTRSL